MLNIRLLSLVLILPFLVNTPTLENPISDKFQAKIEARQMEGRAEVLQAYLAQYNSPLKYQAQILVDAADENSLDWKLVPAIAGVESTFGKYTPGGYNAWGWGVYGKHVIYFRSYPEAIYAVSKGLKENYINKGLTTPAAINKHYSVSKSWSAKVNHFVKDIKIFEKTFEKNNKKAIARINLELKTAGSSALPTK